MTKKISFFVVTVAAVTLVLSGCGKGPGMDMPDEQSMAPAYVGEWHFTGAVVELEAAAFTVTVDGGGMPLGMEPPFSLITKVVVKGAIAAEDGAFMFTVGEDAESVQLTFAAPVPEADKPAATAVATGALKAADDASVMIEIDAEADPVTMTVTGSFITTLLGMPPGTALTACKGAPCMMAP